MSIGERPLHNSVGIELVGLDLDKNRAVEIVRTAVHQHACVLLRAQDLLPQQLRVAEDCQKRQNRKRNS